MPEPDSLEAALESLESIVKEMESGDLPLESLISKYESGVKLTKYCRERLAAAEKRVELITKDASGDIRVVDFDPESDE